MASADSTCVLTKSELKRRLKNIDFQLGIGFFGPIYGCKWEGKEAAIEYIDIDEKDNVKNSKRITQFCELWYFAEHKNIVSFYGLCFDGAKAIIVMEWPQNGRLSDRLGTALKVDFFFKLLSGILDALVFIISQAKFKVDLTLDNIFIDSEGNPKLFDFRRLKSVPKEVKDTKAYESYSLMCFALVVFEILTADCKVKEVKIDELSLKMAEFWPPDVPDWCPSILKFLIEECWLQDRNRKFEVGEVNDFIKFLEVTLVKEEYNAGMPKKIGSLKIEEYGQPLICVICGEFLKDPIIFSCQHSGCMACLIRKVKKDNELRNTPVKCPCCAMEQQFSVVEIFAKRIQNKVFDVVLDRERSCERICPECSLVTAVSFCSHCKKFMCKKCKANYFKGLREMEVGIIVLDEQIAESQAVVSRYSQGITMINKILLETSDLDSLLVKNGTSVSDNVIQALHKQQEELDNAQETCLKQVQRYIQIKVKYEDTIPLWCHQKNQEVDDLLKEMKPLVGKKLREEFEEEGFAVSKHSEPGDRCCYEDINEQIWEEIHFPSNPCQVLYFKSSFVVSLPMKDTVCVVSDNTMQIIQTSCSMDTPEGICITNNGDIAVADNANDRIIIFNEKFEVINISENNGQKLIGPLQIVQCYSNGRFYVSTSSGIFILDSNLQILKEFGKGILRSAYGISLGKNNEVFVTEYMTYELHHFTLEGEHVKTVKYHESKIPGGGRGLLIDESGYILISDASTQAVRVLNPDFSEFTTFGKGVLKHPVGICLLPSGRVAVVDWYAEKMFIF